MNEIFNHRWAQQPLYYFLINIFQN
jgi:hypothetical protein